MPQALSPYQGARPVAGGSDQAVMPHAGRGGLAAGAVGGRQWPRPLPGRGADPAPALCPRAAGPGTQRLQFCCCPIAEHALLPQPAARTPTPRPASANGTSRDEISVNGEH